MPGLPAISSGSNVIYREGEKGERGDTGERGYQGLQGPPGLLILKLKNSLKIDLI